MQRAWTRDIPDSFTHAITGSRGRRPDVALARHQHSDYRGRLADSGLDVISLSAEEAQPDCVFIEDAAVFLRDLLVATRPGAPARLAEVQSVLAAIDGHPLATIEDPGTLDGGDVMVMGGRVFVGLSERSNSDGIGQLKLFAADRGLETVVVEVSGVLHLKSGVLPIDAETVVVTPGTVDEGRLAGLRVIHEHPAERHGFSALPLPDRVLVTTSAPQTAGLVAEAGFEVDPIGVSEILAADGGLTCMSLIEPKHAQE